MKVLIDECVDPAMCQLFTRHEALSTLEAGLTSVANGELLRAAQNRFDAFVTVDKGILFQQNLAAFDMVFILLRIGSNRADRIAPYLSQIEEAIDSTARGTFCLIEPSE